MKMLWVLSIVGVLHAAVAKADVRPLVLADFNTLNNHVTLENLDQASHGAFMKALAETNPGKEAFLRDHSKNLFVGVQTSTDTLVAFSKMDENKIAAVAWMTVSHVTAERLVQNTALKNLDAQVASLSEGDFFDQSHGKAEPLVDIEVKQLFGSENGTPTEFIDGFKSYSGLKSEVPLYMPHDSMLYSFGAEINDKFYFEASRIEYMRSSRMFENRAQRASFGYTKTLVDHGDYDANATVELTGIEHSSGVKEKIVMFVFRLNDL
jgi:hypothetical protein